MGISLPIHPFVRAVWTFIWAIKMIYYVCFVEAFCICKNSISRTAVLQWSPYFLDFSCTLYDLSLERALQVIPPIYAEAFPQAAK